jgi:ubiquinone/menaquinone biosynthesis C-methylase UbiE
MSHHADAATTPEMWAENFETSTKLNAYRRAVFRLDHRWRLIRKFIRPGGRILDAGCGAGEWVAFLNEQQFVAEGVDYSPELIARTRSTYPQHRWKVGAIQELPYESASFDAIISWGVIEHDQRGPSEALREFKRVVKPGGVVIVTVPVDSERQRRSSRSYFPNDARAPREPVFFQYFMTIDELARYVRDAGFTVVSSGLERSTALSLLCPAASARMGIRARHALNKLVRLLFWWHRGIMNMTYCIGRSTPDGSAPRS